MKMIPLATDEVAYVSDEDYDEVIKYSWSINSGNHVSAYVNGKFCTLQKLITIRMGIKRTGEIDHKDRNKLNNQRDNLRHVTKSQNQHNSKRRKDNTSDYRGVNYSIRNRKWVARIQINGERISLGHFNTPEEAYAAYVKASHTYMGEYSNV